MTLLEEGLRHIYLAPVLQGIRKHTWDTIPRDGSRAHGLHGYHHQSEQRVHGFGVEQVQLAISEARGFKEGDYVDNLFADDCLLYRQIYNKDDQETLQWDLHNLELLQVNG